jgi:CheY-like chemotaxis protein
MHDSQIPPSDIVQSPRKVILIVEDDVAIGEFLVQAIAQETPYFALHVTDSTRAFEVTRQLKVDLFLLDYRLPSVNGLELYTSLHAQPGMDTIPAIILTASLERHKEEIERHNLTGLDKPIELDDLLVAINRYLT